MAKLKSGIIKHYNSHFILEEDSLRRIQAIFDKAAKELTDEPEVVFRVEREDDRFYETLNIKDVLDDPNVTGRRVGSVSVELRQKVNSDDSQIHDIGAVAKVEFFSEDKFRVGKWRNRISFEISHDNRNWALLLADEIEPQIQRTLKAKGFPRLIFIISLLPFILIYIKIIRKYWPHETGNEPFNGLMLGATIVMCLLVAIVWILSFETPPTSLSRFLGPESVFLWGDEVQELMKFREHDKIFSGGYSSLL